MFSAARLASAPVLRRLSRPSGAGHLAIRTLASSTSTISPPAPPKPTPAVTDPWDIHPPQDDTYEPPVFRPISRPNESLDAKRARLVWQSRKRGILESDLILSTFAAKQLATLSPELLDAYDKLLEENDWDIYYWATEKKTVPEHINKEVMSRIQQVARNEGRKILKMPELDEFEKAK